jgi:hypothetical protein
VLLLGIVAGLLVFAAGVALASVFLPEWRAGQPADEALFRERYRELAARAGFVLEPGEPRVFLTTGTGQSYESFRPQGDAGSAWLLASRTGFRVEAFHGVRGPGNWPDGRLGIDFSLDGKPQLVSWWDRRFNPFRVPEPAANLRFAEGLIPLLLQPGESLGPRRQDFFAGMPRLMVPLQGAPRPEHLLVFASQSVMAGRRPGKLTETAAEALETAMGQAFTGCFGGVFGFLLVAGVFLVLAVRARLSVVNGALLALIALATLRAAPTISLGSPLLSLMAVASVGLWIFLLWSCAESLLRSTDAGFTTSLDALRTGRLGPRGGRALLLGLAFGAALAGLRLALLCLAEVLPGLWPTAPSLTLPLAGNHGSPVADGISLAAGVALALALAFRILPRRWAPVAAVLAAGTLLAPLSIHPYVAQAAAGILIASVLIYVARRHGLTALLTATVVAGLLPAAAFSALHLAWMPGAFAATTAPLVAVALVGWLGLSRSPSAEIARLSPPAFVRRLEEERRLKHEMDLLARMQRGLLPRTLPGVEGYEIAARSVLANEAGGDLYDVLRDEDGHLWLAAGDVAGHGYSCAIAQAMTKAALASLIGRERTPAEVLRRMERVLRAAGPKRTFTTLALLRLKPETGEALLSNAGHPYPLLASNGEVEELALSGLPLGQGPARRYEDRAFQLPSGGALVFCSDGLFEAADGEGSLYGYDRARTILRVAAGRSAGRILEALMADWRHHLRTAQPLDDTTVVVLKRLREGEAR